MEIKLEEHTVPKITRWGTVQRSLNQHIVSIKTDDSAKWLHCGYVGTSAFLPLSGFPNELVPDVARLCGEHLGRDVSYVNAPPTMAEIQAGLDSNPVTTTDDEDDE
jgi:hypothetical protein